MNSKKLEKSFPQLLTKEERTMLAKRITLYSLILNDFSDLDIKQILKVSYETIRSAKLALETKDTNFQSDLKKLIKKEDPKFLKFLGLVLRSKTSSKARNQLVNNS
jgi:Trp operon repressor